MKSSKLLENKKSVPSEFDEVAHKYDFATFLSQGYQSDLDLSAKRMNLNGSEYIADLCCGTGKSTEACSKQLTSGKIIGIDNSKEMLEVANSKFHNLKIGFVLEDVMELNFPDNTFDAIFMAYGIRNMPDYNKCLLNLKRMLKPDGIICFHEYSLNNNVLTKLYWKILGNTIIIPISTLLSGSSNIFKYLVKSVLSFPSPDKFMDLLIINGFTKVERLPMPSWRRPILHTFLAHKAN